MRKLVLLVTAATLILAACSNESSKIHLTGMNKVHPECIGSKCLYRKVADLNVDASPQGQVVFYTIKWLPNEVSMGKDWSLTETSGHLNKCVVASRENFTCDELSAADGEFSVKDPSIFPFDLIANLAPISFIAKIKGTESNFISLEKIARYF